MQDDEPTDGDDLGEHGAVGPAAVGPAAAVPAGRLRMSTGSPSALAAEQHGGAGVDAELAALLARWQLPAELGQQLAAQFGVRVRPAALSFALSCRGLSRIQLHGSAHHAGSHTPTIEAATDAAKRVG